MRLALVVVFILVATSCEDRSERVTKPLAVLELPAAVQDVVDRECRFCHLQPAPAGVDLSTSTSFRFDQLPLLVNGLERGLLPLIEPLAPADRATLSGWCVDLGFAVHAPAPPSVLRWSSDEALGAGLSHATAFVLEDGFIDHTGWTVFTAPDGGPGLRIDQSHKPGSMNPTSYIGFPVPFHELAGDQSVTFKMRCGRWSGMALRVQSAHPTSRDDREYVRLFVDRDAVGIISVPTPLETRPPRVEEPFGGTYYADGFYLTKSQVVGCEFAVRDSGLVAVYTARVVRESDGRLLADLRATSTRGHGARGSFVFVKYGLGGPTDYWDVEWVGAVGGSRRPPRLPGEHAP